MNKYAQGYFSGMRTSKKVQTLNKWGATLDVLKALAALAVFTACLLFSGLQPMM